MWRSGTELMEIRISESPLTAVGCAQVHFQSSGSREALVALRERADTGGLVGGGVTFLHDGLWLPLPPAAVVHQMGVQVPLTPEPDSASFAGKDVLWRDRGGDKGDTISALSYLCTRIKIKKEPVHMRTLPVATLKASVKRLFHQILRRCISPRCYHGVGALSQGQTRTLDHLLTEASLLS